MSGRLGFIHEKIDIKILILFILARLSEPVDMETLADLTLCDDGISYFDFAECLAELVDTDHISTDGAKYTITEKGIRNGKITETGIPYSVRMKAEKSTAEKRSEMSRDALIHTSRMIQRGGGYTVTLSLSDGVGEIIKMDLMAVSEQQAKELEKGFRRNAENIYNKLIEYILEK